MFRQDIRAARVGGFASFEAKISKDTLLFHFVLSSIGSCSITLVIQKHIYIYEMKVLKHVHR